MQEIDLINFFLTSGGGARLLESDIARKYVTVKWRRSKRQDEDGYVLLGLLLYVQKEWKLPNPTLLISITGECNNNKDGSIKVLRKVVQVAKKVHSWIITGGISSEIAKQVGKTIFTDKRMLAENNI